MTSHKANIVVGTLMALIVIVVFAMVIYFGWSAFSGISTDVIADLTENSSIQIVQDVETRYPSVFDGLFMLVFLGMWAFVIVAAFMSDAHPMLFGFSLLLIVFVLIIAAMLANGFEETFMDESFAGVTASFPMSFWVVTHLLQMTLAITATVILALMGKNKL